jgi:hypothetical protein
LILVKALFRVRSFSAFVHDRREPMAVSASPEKPKSIMLATDLTPAGDRALDRAVQLSVQWDAPLTVCHVVEASSLRPWGIERRV